MLIIRKDQIRAFESIDRPRFEKEMLKHVAEHFPKHFELIGEETILDVIRNGIERADDYGFTTRQQACLFIDFMIMIGHGFDDDPQIPWVADILNDETLDHKTRMDRIYDEIMTYLDHVIGKEEVFPVTPWRNMLEYPIGQLEERIGGDIIQGTIAVLKEIWPQKFRYVGQEQLESMCNEGIEAGHKYGLRDNRSIGLYLILMFLLGHRFDTDLQFKSLGVILSGKKIDVKEEKFHSLYITFKNGLTEALG